MTFARRFTESREAREEARADRFAQRCTPSRALTAGTYQGATSGPDHKTEAYRDPALLEMARNRPCLLMVPAVCNHRTDTAVACHSNSSEHGKAGHRKADDCYSVHGCSACHYWLDFGKASRQAKEAAFMAAHARMVLTWRLIAMDPAEPERFRKAAQRVLAHLNATPVPGEQEA